MIRYITTFFLLLVVFSNCYSQNLLCICFEKDTEFISVSFSNDSLDTQFKIVREGYETSEKREKALEKFYQKKEKYPRFYYNYSSVNQPRQKVNSIKELPCAVLITVDEFRKNEFNLPKGVERRTLLFIKKNGKGTFFKWKASNFGIQVD